MLHKTTLPVVDFESSSDNARRMMPSPVRPTERYRLLFFLSISANVFFFLVCLWAQQPQDCEYSYFRQVKVQVSRSDSLPERAFTPLGQPELLPVRLEDTKEDKVVSAVESTTKSVVPPSQNEESPHTFSVSLPTTTQAASWEEENAAPTTVENDNVVVVSTTTTTTTEPRQEPQPQPQMESQLHQQEVWVPETKYHIMLISNRKLNHGHSEPFIFFLLYQNPDATIHIMADLSETTAAIQSFQGHPRARFYHAEDVVEWDEIKGRLAYFTDIYRHWSVNDLSYERYCFARYIFVAGIVERFGLKNILFMDDDILLLQPLEDILKGRGFDDGAISTKKLITIGRGFGSSYFQFWPTPDYLNALRDFITSFYEQPIDDMIGKIREWGDGGQKPESFVQSGSDPVLLERSEDLNARQWSDMPMFKLFVASIQQEATQEAARANQTFVEDGIGYLFEDPWGPERATVSALQTMAWITPKNSCMKEKLNETEIWSSTFTFDLQEGEKYPSVSVGGVKLHGLHFQGFCKRLISPFLSRYDVSSSSRLAEQSG